MGSEEKGSDAMLGAAAIDQEKERAAKEEIALAKEEEITENAPKADDGLDTEVDDVDPPMEEEHDEYDPLPPPVEEF